MSLDPALVHRLGAVTRTARAAARAAGRDLTFERVPDFTLLVLGPVDAGKTTLVRALCADVTAELGMLTERPGRDTPVPVELLPGPRVEVLLGIGGTTQEPKTWMRARPSDTGALQTAGLRRVRALAPARTLLDWQLRIVDTPGIDDLSDLTGGLLDEVRKPGVGVLYVVPSRGTTNLDVQILTMLRVPTVLVENLRESELIASRAALDELAAPGTSTTHAVPMMVTRLAVNGPERELLRRCTALLRTLCLPPKVPARIRKTAVRTRATLRREYARRLHDVVSQRDTTEPLRRLHLAAALWRIERDGPAITTLDAALTEVANAVAAAPTPDRLREVVGVDARAAIDRYNIEAACNAVAAAAPRTIPPPELHEAAFATSYAAVRNSLLATIDNILADDRAGLTKADRRPLLATRGQVVEDRIEVALIGQFSSGKSSLINALLGVPPTEKFLPAKPRPTTATVNRVVHSETPSIEAVWCDEIELDLLVDGGEDDRLRASMDEIRALGTWLRDGTVRPEDCTFRSMRPDGIAHREQIRAFWALWKLLDMDGRQHKYVYVSPSRFKPRLTDPATPVRATVSRFARHPEQWADGLDRQAAFDVVKESPALALQIDELRVGADYPLLRHVAFIDTPGTDAPIPHHLLTARRAVSDRPQCVVVYCFNGIKASSAADASNLTFLRSINIGGSQLSRFFFVITQKGLYDPRQHEEVRGVVRAQLHKVHVEPSRLYYTEVYHEINDEFLALAADINRFVADSKGPLLRSWIHHARAGVTAVHARHRSRLDDIKKGERSRLAHLAALEAEAQTLREIRHEFETSVVWGVPTVPVRVGRAIEPEIRELDTLVEKLTSREAFTGIGEPLDAGVEDLNEAARRAVYGGCKAVAEKLRVEIGTRLPGRTISPPEPQHTEEFFRQAGITQAVADITWRTWRQRFTGLFRARTEGWNDDIEANRDRIGGAWRRSRDRGRPATGKAVERQLGQLRAELTRVADAIQDEISDAARPPSPEDAAAASLGSERATAWLSRLDALDRAVEGKAG